MEKKSGIIGSILKSSFAFGIIVGIIEGVTVLLQSLISSPMRVTGDTLESILKILYMAVISNVLFIIIMNFTVGMILYLILRKLLKQYANYTFIFVSGFFMAFNILSYAFTTSYIINQISHPLPLFVLARTAFYSVLVSIGAIILYRYIVSKWGWEKAIRVFISLAALLLATIPFILLINRIYIPFSLSLKSLLVNIVILIALLISYFLMSWIYRILSKKYKKTFMIENPLIPAVMFLLLLSPFIYSLMAGSDLNLKPKTDPERPNVVLISVDTLRADALKCYGNEKTDTNNIDSVAAQGIRFQNAYSQAPWTLTSIGSFMTGLYPTVNGLNKPLLRLDSNRETIAKAFRNAGYNTVAVATNGWNKQNFGMDLGFENYNYQGDAMWILSFNHSLWNRMFIFISTKIFKSNVMYSAYNPNEAKVVTDISIKKLEEYKDSNFFMWIHYLDPHDPYTPPREYQKKFSKGYKGRYMTSSGRVNGFRTGIMLEEKDKAQIENLYLAEVEYTDREIGRIIDTLDRLNLGENTIVALIADHGEEFWEHNGVTHGHCLHWHQLHIPFILRWKGNIEPKVIEDRVALLDLKPTLLSLCGIQAGEIMQGFDLSSVIRNGDEDLKLKLKERDLYAEALIYFEEQKSVYDDNYKYVYSEVTHKEELYDLKNDPLEKMNIIASEEELAQKYRDSVGEWRTVSENIAGTLPKEDADSTSHLDEETLQQLRALGYIN